jgi:SET domain-containing protein
MGRGVFPSASFLNHSCDPNCVPVQEGKKMNVYTSRDVQQGIHFVLKHESPFSIFNFVAGK